MESVASLQSAIRIACQPEQHCYYEGGKEGANKILYAFNQLLEYANKSRVIKQIKDAFLGQGLMPNLHPTDRCWDFGANEAGIPRIGVEVRNVNWHKSGESDFGPGFGRIASSTYCALFGELPEYRQAVVITPSWLEYGSDTYGKTGNLPPKRLLHNAVTCQLMPNNIQCEGTFQAQGLLFTPSGDKHYFSQWHFGSEEFLDGSRPTTSWLRHPNGTVIKGKGDLVFSGYFTKSPTELAVLPPEGMSTSTMILGGIALVAGCYLAYRIANYMLAKRKAEGAEKPHQA